MLERARRRLTRSKPESRQTLTHVPDMRGFSLVGPIEPNAKRAIYDIIGDAELHKVGYIDAKDVPEHKPDPVPERQVDIVSQPKELPPTPRHNPINRDFVSEPLTDQQRFKLRDGALFGDLLEKETNGDNAPHVHLAVDTSTNCIAFVMGKYGSADVINPMTGELVIEGKPEEITASGLATSKNGKWERIGRTDHFQGDDDSSNVKITRIGLRSEEGGIAIDRVKQLSKELGADPEKLRWGFMAGEQRIPYSELTPKQKQEVLIDAMAAIASVPTGEERAKEKVKVIDGLAILAALEGNTPFLEAEEIYDRPRMVSGLRWGAASINLAYVSEALNQYPDTKGDPYVQDAQLREEYGLAKPKIPKLKKIREFLPVQKAAAEIEREKSHVEETPKPVEIVVLEPQKSMLKKTGEVLIDTDALTRVSAGTLFVLGTPLIFDERLLEQQVGWGQLSIGAAFVATDVFIQNRRKKKMREESKREGFVTYDHRKRI